MQTDSVIEWNGNSYTGYWHVDADGGAGRAWGQVIGYEEVVCPHIGVSVEVGGKAILEAKVPTGNMDLAKAIAEAAIRHELGKGAAE